LALSKGLRYIGGRLDAAAIEMLNGLFVISISITRFKQWLREGAMICLPGRMLTVSSLLP
jgi:hypothetical protein